MEFAELARYFDKLEETSSRLALIDILADLFKKTDSREIPKIMYLLQGRVAPFFAPIEIGMADKMVAQAIAEAFGTKREKVLKEYDRKGDLGTVAMEEKAHAGAEKTLSVSEVFEWITQIAETSGAGSVEKKITLFRQLLTDIDEVSVKHLVRIVLGKMRLGIGDPTILDALALARLGDRSRRKLLEKAYNETSDLGLIGGTLLAHGLPAVEKLTVTVGRPIRSELAERLPNVEKVFSKMVDGKTPVKAVHAQFKYDGFRCVGGFTPVYVKEKGITAMRDLQIGDTVLTKDGSYKAVLAKQKRIIQKKEKLFGFQTYLGDEIKISEGHPLLCLQEKKQVWIPIEKITPGCEVVFPRPQFPPNNPPPAPKKLELQTISGYRKTFMLNEKFFRFLGFWIGDGFTNDFHNTKKVGLTFNARREQELAKMYEGIVRETLQVSQISRSTRNGGLNLYWRDEPLKQWLSTYFRREWRGKTLPLWFSHVTKQHFKQFLLGWIESDGHVDKDGVTKIITKERDLAAFAQLIGLSFGFIIGLHYIRSKNKTYYQLVIPRTSRYARVEGDKIIVKVKKNTELIQRDPRTALYDIQVEAEESFCAPMATLHNCQIHKDGNDVHIFSRNLENMTHMFPELIDGARRQIKAKTAIVDSEALAYQPESEEFLPFQETTKRRRKHNIEEIAKSLPLKAFVFDILYVDGQSLLDMPLLDRIEILKKTVHSDTTLIPAPGELVKDPKTLQIMLDDAISKGLEGIVVKRIDSPYVAGARNFNWVKLKRHSDGALEDTVDCVILGYIFGRGKRTEFGAGALLVGVYDPGNDEFVTVTKIGTGLSDEEWKGIKERTAHLEIDHKPARVRSQIMPSVWVRPEIVIEVLADEITRSPVHTAGMTETEPGYALRFPRLIKFRDSDKQAEDATTVKELIEMYNQQGKK